MGWSGGIGMMAKSGDEMRFFLLLLLLLLLLLFHAAAGAKSDMECGRN